MAMYVSVFRYPRAPALAAWKMRFNPSRRALLHLGSHLARIFSLCRVTVSSASKSGFMIGFLSRVDGRYRMKWVRRHLAPKAVLAVPIQRSIFLARQALAAMNAYVPSAAGAAICFLLSGPSAFLSVARRVSFGSSLSAASFLRTSSSALVNSCATWAIKKTALFPDVSLAFAGSGKRWSAFPCGQGP